MATNNAVNRVITATPTANAIPIFDGNANLSANSLLDGYTTTVRAISTNVTLTVASTQTQFFTGDASFGTDNIIMPVASTLVLGQSWLIVNTSTTYALTVQSSGGNTIISVPAGFAATVVCVLTSGTSAASWYGVLQGAGVAPGVTVGGWTPTLTAATPGTLSVSYSTQTGSYIRWTTTGGSSFVNIYCSLTCTATNGTASGDMRITGLPFTANNNGASSTPSACSANWTWGAGLTMLAYYISQSPIAVRIFKMGTANNGTSMAITDITSGTSNIYRFQMTYQI